MSAVDGLAQVNTLATNTALTVWSAASDFLIIIVLLTTFFLFAWYVGRGQLVAVLLAFYASYAIYAVFPYKALLPTAPATTALFSHIGLYAFFTLIFYIILRRVVVSDFLYIGIFGVIALSFLGSAFLLAMAYHVFAVTSAYTFSPAVAALFEPARFFYWWFIAPAIGLFFLAR